MNIIRLFSAFGVLAFISLFLFSNMVNVSVASGYKYLGFLFLPLIVLFIIAHDSYVFSKTKKSTFVLILFLLYFIINYLIDTMDLQEVKAVTIGTTGGLIFGLFLGVICSFSISIIYQLIHFKKVKNIAIIVSLIYILLVLQLSISTFQFHFSEIRSDLFLIANQEGLYQRVGNFIFIQFMIVGSLIAGIIVASNKPRLLLHLILVVLFSIIAFIFALTSQLVGSNSGSVSVIGFLFVYFIFYFIQIKSNNYDITLKSLFLGKLGWLVFRAITFLLFAVSAVVLYIANSMSLDLDRFRIMGFGTGHVNSIDARIKIFEDNFLEQFSYNPIFGHTQVHELTTGAGSYAHSLISLASHLGFVGLFLFIFFIVLVYKDLSRKAKVSRTLFSNKRYSLFRMFAIGAVLIFATVSAFYTWLPLWFAVGLFGLSLYEKKPVKE